MSRKRCSHAKMIVSATPTVRPFGLFEGSRGDNRDAPRQLIMMVSVCVTLNAQPSIASTPTVFVSQFDNSASLLLCWKHVAVCQIYVRILRSAHWYNSLHRVRSVCMLNAKSCNSNCSIYQHNQTMWWSTFSPCLSGTKCLLIEFSCLWSTIQCYVESVHIVLSYISFKYMNTATAM
jgi:hypothetical protein